MKAQRNKMAGLPSAGRYARLMGVLCILQGGFIYVSTSQHRIGIEITIREHPEAIAATKSLLPTFEWIERAEDTNKLHQSPMGTSNSTNFKSPDAFAVSAAIKADEGLLRNAQQCHRNYGAALNFTTRYPTKEDCPTLPHFGLAFGKRIENGSANNNFTQATYLPKDCRFKWFHPEDACDLLGSLGVLYFQGDSLIRQLLVGLGAVLDGNFRTGGIGKATSLQHLEACQCEKSWQCWKDGVTHRFTSGEPQYGICPKWTRNHVLVDTDSLDHYRQQQQKNTVSTPQRTPLIGIGNGDGLHNQLDFRKVFTKLDALRDLSANTGGTFIPMTVHWPGPNKPVPHKIAQGEQAVQHFNTEMRRWSMFHDLWPLETYEFTKGMWSRDGTHYDDDNIVLVQILLNHLWYMQRHGKLAVVPEENAADPTNFRPGQPEDVNVETNPGPVPRPY